MTETGPEREFIIWFSTRQHMVAKRYRLEVRAHMVKALGQKKLRGESE